VSIVQGTQDETVTTLGDRESSLEEVLIAKIIKCQCKMVHCRNGADREKNNSLIETGLIATSFSI